MVVHICNPKQKNCHEFKANLWYIATACLKPTNQPNKTKVEQRICTWERGGWGLRTRICCVMGGQPACLPGLLAYHLHQIHFKEVCNLPSKSFNFWNYSLAIICWTNSSQSKDYWESTENEGSQVQVFPSPSISCSDLRIPVLLGGYEDQLGKGLKLVWIFT